jgi:fructose-bisphosphate aldolase class 1
MADDLAKPLLRVWILVRIASQSYAQMAPTAKWRAVITIGADIPSRGCRVSQTRRRALVPGSWTGSIVEPEVLDDGQRQTSNVSEVTAKSPANGLPTALHPAKVMLEAIPQAQHGVAGIDQSLSKHRWRRLLMPRCSAEQ